jgi:HK97 family phage major capsid protein
MRNAGLLATTALASLGPIFMMAGPQEAAIQALRDKAQQLQDEADAIVAKADQESRELSDDEIAKVNAHADDVEKLAGQIAARERIARPSAGTGRRTAAEPVDENGRTVPAQPRISDRKGGFKSFGEFAVQVRAGSANGAQPDKRLLNAATTYGSEGTGADGGFAVPPEFRQQIWQTIMAEENLLSRCAQLVTGANSMTIPKDEVAPWDNSTGIAVYWEAEAGQVTGTKPALGLDTIRLSKLMALVPVSDELLEDAPGLESWLRAKAPAKMAAKINTAIIAGTGVGQPLGILNSPAIISIAEETSQAAATLLFENVKKMWGRMYAPSRRNAIWLINQDCEQQLNGMAFDHTASSKVPIYMPQNSLSNSPYAALYGRPVVPMQACSTLGTQGDIILADLSQYWALTKGQDIRTDVSMHLYFDQGLQAFRFTFRVNGQPSWSKAVSPQNGSNTLSPFVTLDTRS